MSTATMDSPATGLIAVNGNGHGGNGLSVYDRIADPIDFINQMGKVFAKAGACGVSTEAEGQLLALACACEKKHAFEIGRRYHIMDGKLVLKADVMLADFNHAGGVHRWLKDGSDGAEAVLFIRRPDGEEMTSSYSLADAKEADLIRAKSNWTKGPKAVGQMLRARATSNGIRMLMPGIVAGVYTPEEIVDEVLLRESKPTRAKIDVDKRREEIQAIAATDAMIDAEVSVPTVVNVGEASGSLAASTPTTAAGSQESAPFDSPATATDSSSNSSSDSDYHEHSVVLLEIEATIEKLGITKAQLEAGLREKNAEFKSLDDLPLLKAQALLENLRAGAAKK